MRTRAVEGENEAEVEGESETEGEGEGGGEDEEGIKGEGNSDCNVQLKSGIEQLGVTI